MWKFFEDARKAMSNLSSTAYATVNEAYDYTLDFADAHSGQIAVAGLILIGLGTLLLAPAALVTEGAIGAIGLTAFAIIRTAPYVMMGIGALMTMMGGVAYAVRNRYRQHIAKNDEENEKKVAELQEKLNATDEIIRHQKNIIKTDATKLAANDATINEQEKRLNELETALIADSDSDSPGLRHRPGR